MDLRNPIINWCTPEQQRLLVPAVKKVLSPTIELEDAVLTVLHPYSLRVDRLLIDGPAVLMSQVYEKAAQRKDWGLLRNYGIVKQFDIELRADFVLEYFPKNLAHRFHNVRLAHRNPYLYNEGGDGTHCWDFGSGQMHALLQELPEEMKTLQEDSLLGIACGTIPALHEKRTMGDLFNDVIVSGMPVAKAYLTDGKKIESVAEYFYLRN